MRLRNRVDRLDKKLPPRKRIVVSWVNPETGRWWMRLTLTPSRNGRDFSVREEIRDPESLSVSAE